VENVTDRSLRFTKVIRFYPEWPTFIARNAMWFGPEVNSVWSFNRPSRLTGSFLACHSIRFSRFKLRRINPLSCGFTRRMPQIRSRRRGDTLRTPLGRVNRFSQHFRGLRDGVDRPVPGD